MTQDNRRTVYTEQIYQGTCSRCNTRHEFLSKHAQMMNIDSGYGQRKTFAAIGCPVCHFTIYAEVNK